MPKKVRKTVSNSTLLHVLKYMAKTYTCYKCGHKVGSMQSLSRHRRNVHPRFICGQCNMKFLQPRRFQLHLRNNTACRQFLQSVEFIDLTGPKQVTSQGDAPTGMISLFRNFNTFIHIRALPFNMEGPIYSLTHGGHFKIKLSPMSINYDIALYSFPIHTSL